MLAARVAAELRKEKDINVETMKGGFGEFSVHIDGDRVIDSNRLLYPTPSKIVKKVKSLLISPDAHLN